MLGQLSGSRVRPLVASSLSRRHTAIMGRHLTLGLRPAFSSACSVAFCLMSRALPERVVFTLTSSLSNRPGRQSGLHVAWLPAAGIPDSTPHPPCHLTLCRAPSPEPAM